ncbi:hypothetical protein HMPREF1487_09478 [Pseudomonas sp. HPB0071]|uniref:Uncharacterized protein n=1 Tax=Pseudomonas luteola TaxID=47886 RepID=A0A2X2BY17_PSELU|nr:hypothetical protein HMPREF1487_09478 [Pseudomonas sp. HPB0071]SPY99974.1 Uncharacterised protein [Pseudomonas luteola]
MLVTDYLVGRDNEGRCLCLVVDNVIPLDCSPGRSDLVSKMSRQDLVQEFVQDGVPVDWITFPDLPSDVVELLLSGQSLRILDQSDSTVIECLIGHSQVDQVVLKERIS